MTPPFKDEILKHRTRIQNAINPYLSAWIATQRCTSVEKISDYRKHMHRLQSILTDLNYTTESAQAELKCRTELENKEAILERQTLLVQCKSFLMRKDISAKTPYTILLQSQQQCDTLINGLLKHAKTLGEESERLSSQLIEQRNLIQTVSSKIKQQMNDVWDALYAVDSIQAVKALISDIQNVCQLGIEETDLTDYKELEVTLQSFLDATNDISECRGDRALFETSKAKYLAHFECAEYDFDVLSILKSVISNIEAVLDEKDKQWCTRYLDIALSTRSDMMKWMDATEVLPSYLSADTRAKYQEKLQQISAEIRKADVEFVVFKFQNLSFEQMQQCYQTLTEIMQSDNPPAISQSPASTEPPPLVKDFTTESSRIPWDLEEWVVLIDLYYKNPMYTRKELEHDLIPYSKMLVHRAQVLGIPASLTYRNINGLAMQMDRIKYSVTDRGTGFGYSSKMQQVAMKLRQDDIARFNEIRDLCWETFGE